MSVGVPEKIALCLSGGGFRATLFHVGSLQRLNQLGILSRVTTFCSVSGGSITAGVLAARWSRLQVSLHDGVFADFDALVAQPLYEFCRADLRTEVLLWDRINPLNWPELLDSDHSITDRLAAAYARHLDLGLELRALPIAPRFVFLATNMENGGPWEFRQDRLGDWYTGYTDPRDITLAYAVAASSAYPVTFPPLRLGFAPPRAFQGGRGRPDALREVEAVTLTDGGIYDNLGIEPVRAGQDVLLVSDAGHPLVDEVEPRLGAYPRVARSLDIIGNQVGAQRKRWLIAAYRSREIPSGGAYWGLGSKVSNYRVPGAPSYDDGLLPLLESVRTDLDSFTEAEIAALVNHGYALANVATRRWTPSLLPKVDVQFRWPCGDPPHPNLVRADLADSHRRGIAADLWQSLKKRLSI